jgi:hypothetical protein
MILTSRRCRSKCRSYSGSRKSCLGLR